MKIILSFLIFLLSATYLSAQTLPNDYTTVGIDAINTAKTALEGDLYHDYQLDIWFIGLTSGELKSIKDQQELNYNSTSHVLNISGGNSVSLSTFSYPQVINKTSNYTIQNGDSGKVFVFNSSSPITLTIPSGLPIGFNISVYQVGIGQVEIVGSGGTIIKNRLNRYKTAGEDAGVGVLSTGTNIYHLTGDVSN